MSGAGGKLVPENEVSGKRLPVEVDPRVPEPLQAIALKAMERDPALRYQSAREIAVDLHRLAVQGIGAK